MEVQLLVGSLEDLADTADSLAYAVPSVDDQDVIAGLRQLAQKIRQKANHLREKPPEGLDLHPKCDETIVAQGELLKRVYRQLDIELDAHMAHFHDEHCGNELCALRAELELMPGVADAG